MAKIKAVPAPAWLDDLKPWSFLTNKDITRIFGFGESGIAHALVKGRFPKPDMVFHGKNYWRVDTLRREIKRRLEESSRKQKGEEQK